MQAYSLYSTINNIISELCPCMASAVLPDSYMTIMTLVAI